MGLYTKGNYKFGRPTIEYRTYRIWNAMLQRCTNPKQVSYERYGARGIKVCERWIHSFDNFLSDMGEMPPGRSIDRIDTNGNYEPSNCRWATIKEQNRNMRTNRNVSFNGITMTLGAWAERIKIKGQTLKYRLDNWPLQEALTTPAHTIKHCNGYSNYRTKKEAA